MMKTLLRGGKIINVFTDSIEEANILMEDDKIIGVGCYEEAQADKVEDVSGKYICPGFIDGHIHIESSMLEPSEFARTCIAHGTTSVIADPHEIANVSGFVGVAYMLEASEGIPMNVFFMLPSCVPATSFDEAGAILLADDLKSWFSHERILGLGEMMNYPGVINKDEEVMRKIKAAQQAGLLVNGHAPLLSGKDLDRYISAGIFDDHECSGIEEAMERIRKGQWVMIRQGTAARNLQALLGLFDEPYCRRCLLVTDDKHPADLIQNGHIDSIIRRAVEEGKSVLTGIRMATLQAAQYFRLFDRGAVAPGYKADLTILSELETVKVCDVYHNGLKVVVDGKTLPFERPYIRTDIWKSVRNSFYLKSLSEKDFTLVPKSNRCRVIRMIPGELLTEEVVLDLNFEWKQGIDIERDIVKLAVIERHNNTGHIGLGFIQGMGIRHGALASSVAHDSHNLIVVGENERDMAVAANRIREIGGGLVVVDQGKVLAEAALPIAGLMSREKAEVVAKQNAQVREKAWELGIPEDHEPFMSMAFVSLPVIPHIKMTTKGLVNVDRQELTDLFV